MNRMPVVVGLLMMVAGASLAGEGSRPCGYVALFRTPAWIERAGNRIEPTVGAPVFENDVLHTGKRGRLKVLFSDDAVVSLGSRSQVRVNSYLFDPSSRRRTGRLELITGKLRALVQKLVAGTRADFQVKASSAVAGVRGTEFVLESEGATSRLVTLSGQVAFAAAGAEPVLVGPGETSHLEDGKAAEPVRLAAAEIEKLKRETDVEDGGEAVAALVLPGRPDRLRGGRGVVEVEPGVASSDLEPEEAAFQGSQGEREGGEFGDVPGPDVSVGNHASGSWKGGTVQEGTDNLNDFLGTWQNPDQDVLSGGSFMRLKVIFNR